SLVAWSDQRSGRSACRASRLDFLGKYPAGWIAGGNLVSLSDSSQELVSSGTDDAAGGFFVYTDLATQFNIPVNIPVNVYLQHLTSSGGVAAGYPPGGKLMAAGYVGVAGMLPDGSGGLFLGWAAGPDNYEKIRVTRLDASGTATAGWPAGGVDTGLRDSVPGEPASDGAGGIYLVWSQGTEVKIQRYTSTGVVSGWPAEGVPLSSSATVRGYIQSLVSDGAGGAIAAWTDLRGSDEDVYAQRVLATGVVDPAWTADGVAICTAAGNQELAAITTDG